MSETPTCPCCGRGDKVRPVEDEPALTHECMACAAMWDEACRRPAAESTTDVSGDEREAIRNGIAETERRGLSGLKHVCGLQRFGTIGDVCPACERDARLAPASAEPGREFSISLDQEEAEFLRDSIGDDEEGSPITLAVLNGHSGFGLYLWWSEYPEEGCCLVKALTSAPPSPAPPVAAGWQPTHRHYKGDEYELLYVAHDECDGAGMAVYRTKSGTVWVRPMIEFNEKFTLITAASPETQA